MAFFMRGAHVLLLVLYFSTLHEFSSSKLIYPRRPRFPLKPRGYSSRPEGTEFLARNWAVSYFAQTLDHFSFRPDGYKKFQQKYIVDDRFWKGVEAKGPIFVYCGNEGPIDWFLENAGFVTEAAEEFGALVVGPEHRYYGESMPFGSQAAAYANADSLAFLTTEQALADMAVLLDSLKTNLSAHGCPVVLFGGSYGGMLAAWSRLKYPHVSVGAVASSAPILQYENLVPTDTFYDIVSKDFRLESESCFAAIRASWSQIIRVGQTEEGRTELKRKFGLCSTPASASDVISWMEDALVSLAMVDYPIPADFLMPLPAHPISQVCKRVDDPIHGSNDFIARAAAGISIYFNFTGAAECFRIGDDPHGMDGWGYQACTEQVMPMSSNASTSMFQPFDWDLTAYAEECRAQFNITPRPHWIVTHFGGRGMKHVLRNFASNIVFANGALDPWSGGGVLENISDTVVSLLIPDGAHHLDLRASTPEDPPSVKWQREEEKKHIQRWISEFYKRTASSGGPALNTNAVAAAPAVPPLHLLLVGAVLPMLAATMGLLWVLNLQIERTIRAHGHVELERGRLNGYAPLHA